jgi:hypothetical protein
MNILHWIGDKIIQAALSLVRLPAFLNWILAVIEPLVVIGLSSAVGYTAFLLLFGSDQDPKRIHAIAAIGQLQQNWKPGLIVLVILFYRTIRTFLEQAEEALGVKKKRVLPGEQLNPSSLENKS